MVDYAPLAPVNFFFLGLAECLRQVPAESQVSRMPRLSRDGICFGLTRRDGIIIH